MPVGIYPRKLAIDRFWSKVQKTKGCWNWIGSIGGGGYGAFWNEQKQVYAHRWAYEHFVGPIPDGLTIDHLCRNRACVNPKHLEPVTMRENTLRGIGQCAQNARKTHCKYGHEFTKSNTRRVFGEYGKWWRECRMCRKKREQKRWKLSKPQRKQGVKYENSY